jgi:hypothetical protein
MADLVPRENIYKRLTRLFRSGPVIRHKVATADQNVAPRGSAKGYKYELSNLYTSTLASYGQYERMARYADYMEMCFCLAGETLIATPDGYRRIDELASEYGLDREFIVYSYDHSRGRIVPAWAKQARQTRVDHTWKVTFDDGKTIIGTSDHRLMLRDGSYRIIGDLRPGDAMMPFYRRSLRSPKGRFDPDHYQYIYDGRSWVAEHRMIASWIMGRDLRDDEVVHHKNFRKSDNLPENLEAMTEAKHRRLHNVLINGKKWDREQNFEWIKSFSERQSKFMRESNPNARPDVTFALILQIAETNDFHLPKTAETIGCSMPFVKFMLRQNGFKDWEDFSKAYCPGWRNHGWDNKGEKNPRYDHELSFLDICQAFEPGMNGSQLVRKLGTTAVKIKNRVRGHGFKSASDFCQNYENCRVVSVEYHGEIPVYDLTVDGYKNFATDSVISHNTPEIASALNIYADEATRYNEKRHVIDIVSKNLEIKRILETLFFDILNIDFHLWSWVRGLCKFGDYVMLVDGNEENGVLNLYPLPINEIEREEGFSKDDPTAIRYRWLSQNKVIQNWQIIHFRLKGDEQFLPYGTSMIEAARRIWRQLILIEDAMLVYRIVRSPERRVFKIDVGGIPADQVEQFMEYVKNKMKRNQVVDPTTGRVDLRYNPLSVDEDYFLPVYGQSTTDIHTLAGGQFTGDIEDVEYIQKKLIAALQIPRAYLGYDESLGSKATLAQEDVRFASTIERIQKVIVQELNKIAFIHLVLLGYDDPNDWEFDIEMASSSTIAEQQRLELWRMRLEVAGLSQEGMFDRNFVRRRLFGLSDEEIEEINVGRKIDKLEDLELEAMQAPTPASPEGVPEAPLPGEEELPSTLGGEVGGGAEAPPEGENLTQSAEHEGSLIVQGKNMGSTGNRSELAVDKGKDLFLPDENLLNHTFGREKQTLSDPYDRRWFRRFVTRPLSNSVSRPRRRLIEDVTTIEDIESSVGDVERFLQELQDRQDQILS